MKGRRSEWWFRLLLRLYPSRFRELYGQDAVELFRDRRREAANGGPLSVTRLWLRTAPNLIVNGISERIRELRVAPEPFALLRHAWRRILRAPALNATIVCTLAVGIGSNVALYSVLRGVLLRPLPYPEAEDLVRLWETNPDVDDAVHGPSPWNFSDWEREADAFESMAAWYLTSGTYRTESWVEEVRSAQVTPDFFRTMGIRPMLGRDFRRDEVFGYGPVVLSHGMWQQRFGGDPAVVGTTITSSGSSYEIVGVMPPDFDFPDASVEAWVAWDLPSVYADRPQARSWRFLDAVARLAPGSSVQSGEEALDRVAQGLAEAYPDMNAGWDVSVTTLHEDVVGNAASALWMVFGAVGFILLIACVDVANLLMARVPLRASELRIRATLGASRSRLVLELLTENAVLAALAGLAGLGLGAVLLRVLVVIDAGQIPRLGEVAIDHGVFLFTFGIAALTSLAFGSAPAYYAIRGTDVSTVLGGTRATGTASHRRLREAFAAFQVAGALVLVTGAVLFATSLERLVSVDPGLETTDVATFRVSLDPVDGTADEIVRYYRGLIDRLEQLSGVVAVGASQALPLNPVGNDFRRPYRPSASGLESADAPTVQMRIVTPGYAHAVGMTLLSGSGFPERVEPDSPLLALVNETLARRLWPDGEAVGESLEIDFRDGWQPYRVLGVLRDVRHYGLRSEPAPEVFLAHDQVPYLAMSLAVRTAGPSETMFEALQSAVRAHRPMQPAHNFVSLETLLENSTSRERFLSVLLSLLAARRTGVGFEWGVRRDRLLCEPSPAGARHSDGVGCGPLGTGRERLAEGCGGDRGRGRSRSCSGPAPLRNGGEPLVRDSGERPIHDRAGRDLALPRHPRGRLLAGPPRGGDPTVRVPAVGIETMSPAAVRGAAQRTSLIPPGPEGPPSDPPAHPHAAIGRVR